MPSPSSSLRMRLAHHHAAALAPPPLRPLASVSCALARLPFLPLSSLLVRDCCRERAWLINFLLRPFLILGYALINNAAGFKKKKKIIIKYPEKPLGIATFIYSKNLGSGKNVILDFLQEFVFGNNISYYTTGLETCSKIRR